MPDGRKNPNILKRICVLCENKYKPNSQRQKICDSCNGSKLKQRLYQVWATMKSRCNNKNNPAYDRYGGRGIEVSKRWNDFENFYKDMASDYEDGLTLDRIDNDGNYSKQNCRWATRKQQANNSRNIDMAKKYYYKGIEDTVKNWANFFGIKRTTLGMRLREYGWDMEKALFTPIQGGGSHR